MDTCPAALEGTSGHLLLTLINSLFLTNCVFDTQKYYPRNYSPYLKDGEVFDFIVVGSGSSGSVVASRLSENPDWKVLLLEAGGYPTPDSEVPALFFNQQLTETDWQYLPEKSPKACLGMKDQQCRWPRGKLLGGCSSYNAMLYVRGHCDLYDEWEKLGNPGWGCQNVTNYFKKSENVEKPELESSPIHGKGGYLSTTHYESEDKMRSVLITAFKEAGIKIGNDEIGDGVYETLVTIKDGRRHSSAKAFLSIIKERENLYVATKALATKILINDDKEVTGVIVQIGEKTLRLRASKEVVVSGGSINSPQLLQLTGIGPKGFINNPIVDLPVGKNLQDHLTNFQILIKFSPTEIKTELDLLKDLFKYYSEFKGPLSRVGVTNIIWFFNTKNGKNPDVEQHFLYYPKNDSILLPMLLGKLGFNEISAKSILEINKEHDLLSVASTLLAPKSRGSIRLKSEDPNEKPLITHGYLEEEDDMTTILDSIEFIRKLLQTEEFKKYEAEFVDFEIPNCKGIEFDTRKYWECSIRNFASTLYHPAGTCRMGDPNDSTTVVDPRLRVLGVKNLRVIDLSITPLIPAGNTNAPAIMIGEKGADLIKEDWGFERNSS